MQTKRAMEMSEACERELDAAELEAVNGGTFSQFVEYFTRGSIDGQSFGEDGNYVIWRSVADAYF